MNNPSIMPNLGSLSPGKITSSSPTAMKEGQLFHGKINQLFPEEMAEIQISSQKLHAKLEVPLKAGDSYYFQVK